MDFLLNWSRVPSCNSQHAEHNATLPSHSVLQQLGFGWDYVSHSFFCCSFEVIALILLQTWSELNRIGAGCVDGWLPAIISFMFLIVACSSHPFLLTPLSFVCLTLLLSIWPTIDKTQSLTILGVLHRIVVMEPCALWQMCACSGFRNEMGCSSRHCLSTFNFQMALTRKTVFLDTHTLSLPLFFHPSSFPAYLPWLFSAYGLGFWSRMCSMRWRGSRWDCQEGRMGLERELWKIRW